MSARKIPVERIGNGGAKTQWADKLPSFGKIKTLSVVNTLYNSCLVPIQRALSVSIKLRASEHWSKLTKKGKSEFLDFAGSFASKQRCFTRR
jgi:hypothetical protein